MRFGVCATIDRAPIVHKAGYDFIECTVVSLQGEKSDAEVKDTLDKYYNSPLPVEAFNVLLPGELKIVGEQVNKERIQHYLSNSLERVQRIGGKSIVFGSGKARGVPDGYSREKAQEQILQFLEWVADVAEPLGLIIVIEPLNRTECNIINSVPEAVQYAEQINRPSIQVLADFYHMYKEEEPLENMVLHQDRLRHIHVSDSRYAPGMGDYPYDQFVDCVRRAGYDGRVSIECQWNQFEDEVTNARAYLERVFSRNE